MVFADLPFRNHRYDAFRMLPVKESNIVFIGNSITNMHEWWEAFGCNPNIINRGVSGAVSAEALANLESIVAGKPAKAFIMLGTNDLGTNGLNSPEQVLNKVSMMVDRFQKESPKTDLYIQSILPSKQGIRTLEVEQATNKALAQLCVEKKITFIDMWQDFLCITDQVNSLDGLHLMASGYEIWCKKIQKYVGTNSIYPTNTKTLQNKGDATGSWGMRNTYFSMYPVNTTDILLIGDEMIHGAEWHELLQSARVKNRGTGWGYPGPSLGHTLNAIPVILHQGKPAKICLYAGVNDINHSNDVNATFTNYQKIVNKIKELAPQTKLYVMGLQPTSNPSINQRVTDFNDLLKQLAATDGIIEYIDLYTPFVLNGVANTQYFNDNYLYGMGYVKVAQEIAKALQETDIKAISDSEANEIYQRYHDRTALGTVITKVEEMKVGSDVGEYSTATMSALRAKVNEAYKLLCDGGNSTQYKQMEQVLQNELTTTLPKLKMPDFSNGTKEYWYKLSTPLRQNRYVTSNGVDFPIIGDTEHNFANGMWKFVKRGDGKIDIINRENKSYINSSAAYNTAIKSTGISPKEGWEFSNSNTAGLFIIHSSNVQLNQTDEHQNCQLYNWSSGQTGNDRNDAGCQFRIEKAGEPTPVNKETDQVMSISQITNGWYKVKVVDGTHADMKNAIHSGLNYVQTVNAEYRQNQTNYYPLKFAAQDVKTPAATYLYITRDNNAFYFTALNGHCVEENCIASRNVPSKKTSISGSNGKFVIGNWTAFNAQDGKEKPYVGKFSSQKAYYHIYKIGENDLNKYDCYKVSIKGVKNGTEIGQDVELTCKDANLQSTPNAYNGGWFFVKKGTELSANDFSASDQQGKRAEITIKDNTITLNYVSGEYSELGSLIEAASSALRNSVEGTNPGCFSKEARATLQSAIQKASAINSVPGKPASEVATAVAEIKGALATYEAARFNVRYSTEGNETWYYIVNAATIAYCQDKVMTSTENGPLTYTDKKLNPNMVWSFWKDNDGKVAIRNYTGKYIGKTQDKGNSNAGMTTKKEHNYTLKLWQGSSNHKCAYTIQSDASSEPLHAQQDGTVIVTWSAADNNASLWNLVQVTPEELNSKVRLTSKIEHVQVTTGIGNKDVALLRMQFILEGLNGNIILNGFKGSMNNKTAVSNVKVYQSKDAFEYRTGKEDTQLLGSATPNADGSFNIQLDKSINLDITSVPYFWLVADINENAKEGDVIDPEITAYVINGEDKVVNQGNPEYTTTVFLTASTVEYLNTYGSRYYRIPAITTAKNGWLVTVTDKRWSSWADLPNNIDVVARVSKDNGKTWSVPVTIAGTQDRGGDYGHGDPAIVTDTVTGDIIVLVTSKVGFLHGTPNNPPLIKMIVSHDNGISWDAPVDITPSIYGSHCTDPVRKNYHSLFVSSGSFHQTKDGTLMAVAPVRTKNIPYSQHAQFEAHIISSSDHGKTWTMSNVNAMFDADESKIVELDNGGLLIKSRKGGHPYYTVSHDGGKTWSNRAQWTEMHDPGCNGDLIRYTSISRGYLKNRLLASIPNASDRSNVSVFLSSDEGKTWSIHKSICPKGSGYSSLTILPDNTIGCYYEEDDLEGGYQLRFVRFSLDWLSNGSDKISTKEEYKTDLINQANAILELKGVGYPVSTAACRRTLQEEVNVFASTPVEAIEFSKIENAILTYKNSTSEIQMPESGKAYIFTNVAYDGTCQYMKYSAQGMNWVKDVADATPFVCKNDNGNYAFVNNDGRYLEWFGVNNTHNDNKGYSETFETKWNYFTISKLIKSQYVNVGNNAQLFGYVYFTGKRLRDGEISDVVFVVRKNNGKDGASVPFFNDKFSSAILMTEVPYANVVQPKPAPNIIGADYIATFSAPFPTVLPKGMKAFYAVSQSLNSDHVMMKPFNGTIPADEGIVVTAQSSTSMTFVPATIEEPSSILIDNLLKASSGKEKVLDQSKNAFVLAHINGQVAFYKAKEGSILPANHAYLSLSSPLPTLFLNFSEDITGLSPLFRDNVDDVMYDCAGRKLYKKPLKGVYIINGNKLLTK